MSRDQSYEMLESVERLLSYFVYEHLPLYLQRVSKPVDDLAWDVAVRFPQNDELEMALRKLLEAKECLLRAVVTESRTVRTREDPAP